MRIQWVNKGEGGYMKRMERKRGSEMDTEGLKSDTTDAVNRCSTETATVYLFAAL